MPIRRPVSRDFGKLNVPALLVAIVGPTAVGKSALALRLAENFGGEIVSADSRQVYRFLDIGTAKPTCAEQARVPHHLIDLINPDQPFGLAEYQAQALCVIEEIGARGALPILAGGTGQYVWAVLENWAVPRVPPDLALRRFLEERAGRDGGGALYTELMRLNPGTAARIDPRNIRRLIRALEISYLGGDAPAKRPPPFKSLIVGLRAPRPELYRRIEVRLDGMIAGGFLDEVRQLRDAGYGADLPALSSIGYRQILQHLSGKLSLAEALAAINIDSHRLVRQQYNWFKPTDERISWFDATEESYPEISRLVSEFLSRSQLGGL